MISNDIKSGEVYMSENTDSIESIPSEETVNPVEAQTEPVDDYSAVIQKKAKFYKKTFKDMDEGERKTSWNWSAFLFPGYWTLYRKMYGFGFIFVVIQLLSMMLSICCQFAEPDEVPEMLAFPYLTLCIGLPLSIVCGALANWYYKKKVDKIIRSAENKAVPERSQYLRKRGGVNAAACIIPALLDVAYIAASFLISYFEARGEIVF